MSGPIGPGDRPSLAAGVRRQEDRVGGGPVLLFPEGVFVLNPTGAAIVDLCDGRRTLSEIVVELAASYDAPPETVLADVSEYLSRLDDRGFLGWAGTEGAAS